MNDQACFSARFCRFTSNLRLNPSSDRTPSASCNNTGVTPMKPGSCAFPYYGVEFAIVEPKSGVELLGNDVEGVLCIKKPWPAIGTFC
jgi:acyl-coenzyme A synthetase/AMP-(fatty) acid ligase